MRIFKNLYFYTVGDAKQPGVHTRRSKGEIIDNYAYGYVSAGPGGAYILPDSLPKYQDVVYEDAITGEER